jgi:hypothetical protein
MEGIKLSNASKMPCKSWSLQARTTCPGSTDPTTKKLVPSCAGCYAAEGMYNMPNVKAVRDHNKHDWQRDAWVDEMVQELDNSRYFRWFDSGDVYSVPLANKIYQVMQRTPWCNHWLPTKSYKFKKFTFIFKKMNSLPNAVVRFSSDSITGGIIKGRNTSTIVQSANDAKYLAAITKMTVCEAETRDGKCGPCRACWNESVPVIAYIGHGRSIKKQYKLMQLTNVA